MKPRRSKIPSSWISLVHRGKTSSTAAGQSTCSRRLLLRRSILEVQLSTTGKHDFSARISGSDIRNGGAIFGGTKNDCDFVAGFNGAARPAGTSQDSRTVCFD